MGGGGGGPEFGPGVDAREEAGNHRMKMRILGTV